MNLEIKENIKVHALDTPNEEVCGLIVKDGRDYRTLRSTNIAFNRKHFFKIDPLLFIDAESKRFKIEAVYHSHPNEKKSFSLFDKINADTNNYNLVLYHNKTDSFDLYEPQKNPYIGRNFKLGVDDCFTILKDVYQKELGIKINEIFRDKYWIKKDNLINCSYEKEGFVRILEGFVNNNELKPFDCIINKSDKFDFASHILIYLGNGKILHHVRNGHSKIETYEDELKEKTLYVLRHRNLIHE